MNTISKNKSKDDVKVKIVKVDFRPINEYDLNSYLEFKAKKHNCYKYYQKDKYVHQIIEEGKLHLTDGQNWDDIIDKRNFNNSDDKYNFGMCFSFSRNESVAMWVMYGRKKDISEKLLIDINRGAFKKALNKEKKIELYGEHKGKGSLLRMLSPSEYDIKLKDILYYPINTESKVATVSDKKIDIRNININLIDNKKYDPWSFENECRLIVSIDKKIIEKYTDKYEKFFIRLPIDITETTRSRVYKSPIYNGEYRQYKPSILDRQLDLQDDE